MTDLHLKIKALYGLTALPFAKEADPDKLFRTAEINQALVRLHYLDSRCGCAALFGPTGCGKSTVIRCFLASLPPTTHACAYLAHGSGTIIDLYRELAWAFELPAGSRKCDLARTIKTRILQLARTRKIKPVIVFDEAHLLTAAFFEELRFLMNYDSDGRDEVTIVLVGQPHLEHALRLAVNEAMAQRVFLRIKLPALDRSQVADYLDHRLRMVGRTAPLFGLDAVEAIAKAAQGIPRIIDLVAEHALIAAAEHNLMAINSDLILTVVEELRL